MMGNEEIKKANRKALPKFIVLCIAAALVGGVMGYFAAANGIDGLSGSIKAAGLKFGMFVAPWIMVAIAVIMPVVLVPYYKKAKKQLLMWDGEDERRRDNRPSGRYGQNPYHVRGRRQPIEEYHPQVKHYLAWNKGNVVQDG